MSCQRYPIIDDQLYIIFFQYYCFLRFWPFHYIGCTNLNIPQWLIIELVTLSFLNFFHQPPPPHWYWNESENLTIIGNWFCSITVSPIFPNTPFCLWPGWLWWLQSSLLVMYHLGYICVDYRWVGQIMPSPSILLGSIETYFEVDQVFHSSLQIYPCPGINHCCSLPHGSLDKKMINFCWLSYLN